MVRRPLLLSGSISTGRSVSPAQAMGADLAYIGSPFVATREANAQQEYKEGIVAGRASDIVYSNLFTGIHGNYLRSSIEASGMDPDNLPQGDVKTMNFESATGAKAWRDIWGSGQGIGAVKAVQGAGEYVDQLAAEYHQARDELMAKVR
jgi:nitronate monooxygenase